MFSCLMDGALWIPQMIPSTNQQIPVSHVRPDTALRCSDRVLAAPHLPKMGKKRFGLNLLLNHFFSHVFPIKKSGVLSVNHGEDSMNLPAHFQSQI